MSYRQVEGAKGKLLDLLTFHHFSSDSKGIHSAATAPPSPQIGAASWLGMHAARSFLKQAVSPRDPHLSLQQSSSVPPYPSAPYRLTPQPISSWEVDGDNDDGDGDGAHGSGDDDAGMAEPLLPWWDRVLSTLYLPPDGLAVGELTYEAKRAVWHSQGAHRLRRLPSKGHSQSTSLLAHAAHEHFHGRFLICGWRRNMVGEVGRGGEGRRGGICGKREAGDVVGRMPADQKRSVEGRAGEGRAN